MEFIPLPLSGLFLLKPKIFQDGRGDFIKSYSQSLFLEHEIDFTPREAFCSISRAGVLRGMHFQTPGAQYGKLVHCVKGRIYDVSLDLRKNSPTYGHSWAGNLDDVRHEAVYLPPGFAHGFYTLEGEAIVSYLVSHAHDAAHDQGVRWNSFGHDWPCSAPIISERDDRLPLFSRFDSPFL